MIRHNDLLSSVFKPWLRVEFWREISCMQLWSFRSVLQILGIRAQQRANTGNWNAQPTGNCTLHACNVQISCKTHRAATPSGRAPWWWCGHTVPISCTRRWVLCMYFDATVNKLCSRLRKHCSLLTKIRGLLCTIHVFSLPLTTTTKHVRVETNAT